MFTTLLASQPASKHSSPSALLALTCHALVLLLAVRVTAHSPSLPTSSPRDTVLLEISNMPADEPAPVSSDVPSSPLPRPARLPRLDLPPVPLPPDGLSVLDSSKLGPSTLGELAAARASQDRAVIATSSSSVPGGAFDTPPTLEVVIEPRYPEALSRTGMSGVVDLEYEVGVDGRVNPASVRVLSSTHPAFASSALESIKGARFRPARRLGRAVAVVVRQRIRFQNR
jgi:periplasmic protein TonB